MPRLKHFTKDTHQCLLLSVCSIRRKRGPEPPSASVCREERTEGLHQPVCRECSQEDPGSQSHGLLAQKQAGSRGTWSPDPGKASGLGIPCSSCLAPYLALTIFPALSSTISSNPTANMSAGLLSPGEQGKRAKKSELPDLVFLFH